MTEQHDRTTSHSRAWQVLVPVLALGAGLLFGTSAALADLDSSPSHPETLVGLIQERNAAVEQLADQATVLQEQINAASDAGPRAEVVTANGLAPVVGTTAVEGPAVQVVLDDAGYTLETLPEGYTVDDVVVHQQDVQGVINALWAGGAEAMMVQDQRIISSSAVRCVGNTLYLQGRVYSPPYTITAIGDPGSLMRSLQDDPTVSNYRAWADILGLGYEVSDLGETELPAFTGTVRPQFASLVEPSDRPTEEEGPIQR
ncbi:DUF881 domain-containing protein [Ornithinimicrobium cryptoxanthini]|uniref:DUF881 domain-containing protein n=1 Tax=Ornithinimicrobium cryptoxanthini TaxID=2934161 RepID=A0ABY4YI68_9MICO|nr:DUF881 domain-containing protein [Ornithinimicrobium cryptoxanthini]USQ76379.1 DUF881 domain-containing protein [Ornithinimicrobium cryptoxanthini]